jgi:hypothetical protein
LTVRSYLPDNQVRQLMNGLEASQKMDVFLIGDVATRFGVPTWQIRRAISRGFLKEQPKLGPNRVFTIRDLPRVRKALLAAGYLESGCKARS